MKKQFSLVFFSWVGVCLLGALPYYFSGYANFTDAVFESVSGFTTTGASVLSDIESLPNWLLLGRAISQWLGGAGFLVIFILLPHFSHDGFQLKKTEISGFETEEFIPRFHKTVFIIILLYITLTALQFILLSIFGMNFFDALVHSLSTISTGGFSSRNGGISYYNSPAIEWVCSCFMFLAGVNLSLIWPVLEKRPVVAARNSELRAYSLIVLTATVLITAAILRSSPSFGTAVRQAFFQVTSLISTTGAVSADYGSWHSAAQSVLFFLMFIGGCSFSAAGGIKVIRWLIISKQTLVEMKRLVYRRGVFNIRLDGKSGNKRAVHGTVGFVFFYLLIALLTAMFVSTCGVDIFTSLTAALACLGNIGASMSFCGYPFYIKWGLCLVMIIGRLELWIVLILFSRNFWRR